MLLERLIAHLGVEVEPFEVCTVGSLDRLQFEGRPTTTLHFVLAGEGTLSTPRGAQVRLAAGGLAVVPPGMPHSFRGAPAADEEPLQIACGRLRATYAGRGDVFAMLDRALVIDYSDDPAMSETFETLLHEQSAGLPGGAAIMTSLMNQCLVRIFRSLCEHDECNMTWLQALEDADIAPALEAMLSDPAAPHTVDSLAGTAHASRSTFVRRFSAAMGAPPMEYLRDVRLREAAALLRNSDRPVGSVARQVGFTSRSHFSRAFADRYGQPPGRWRSPLAGDDEVRGRRAGGHGDVAFLREDPGPADHDDR